MAIENPSSNHTAHQINGPEQLLKGTLSSEESEKQNTAIKKQAARIAEGKEDLDRQLREKKESKNYLNDPRKDALGPMHDQFHVTKFHNHNLYNHLVKSMA